MSLVLCFDALLMLFFHLTSKIVWPSAVRNWELLYSAKIKFHGKISGGTGPEINGTLSNGDISPAYGLEPVRPFPQLCPL